MDNSYTFQLENVMDNITSKDAFLTSGNEIKFNTMIIS